jgi:glycosyltransferase involved in cell wall biosynthesis
VAEGQTRGRGAEALDADVAERSLRVRHLVKGLGPGGAERLVVTQVTASRRSPLVGPTEAVGADRTEGPDARAVEYDVAYLLAHKNHLVPELEARDVTTRCLEATGAWSVGWIVRLRRLLAADPVDIVHVHSPVLASVTRLLVRSMPRRHRPVVIGTEHNRWPRHHRLTRWVNRATIGWQDVTIAVSDDVRTTMSRRAAARAVVVEHGVDLERVRASADREGVRAELGVADEDILIVCIANLRREKALEVLLAAAAEAVGDEPRLRYVLVGQGPLAAALNRQSAASPARDRVDLLGYRADSTRILSGADIFTLSSRHEGLPVAIMEALALGVPVVATAAGGIPDAIGAGGITVPVDDHEALATTHVELARDDTHRHRLAEAAADEGDRFSADRATEAIEQIYVTALLRDRAPT